MDAIIVLGVCYAVGVFVVNYAMRWVDNDLMLIPRELFALFWPVSIVLSFIVFVGVLLWSSLSGVWSKVTDVLDWAIFKATAKLEHEDESGQLYSKRSPDDFELVFGDRRYRPFKAVKVRDSTGTYWIRVDPECRTAKGAVAWTYGLSEKNYDPARY